MLYCIEFNEWHVVLLIRIVCQSLVIHFKICKQWCEELLATAITSDSLNIELDCDVSGILHTLTIYYTRHYKKQCQALDLLWVIFWLENLCIIWATCPIHTPICWHFLLHCFCYCLYLNFTLNTRSSLSECSPNDSHIAPSQDKIKLLC